MTSLAFPLSITGCTKFHLHNLVDQISKALLDDVEVDLLTLRPSSSFHSLCAGQTWEGSEGDNQPHFW